MIHVHHEETSRIVSGVKQKMDLVCTGTRSDKGLNAKLNGTDCILEEGPVVDAIARRQDEIGKATHDILNCKSYKALQEHGPK